MTDEITINKPYRNERAYLKIKAVIRNPNTMEQTPVILEGIVDTGFDGGLFVPSVYKSDLETIRVTPRKTSITLADGRRIPVETCLAYIQEVENIELPAPGIPVSFILCGRFEGSLIGMNFLRNCVTEVDGIRSNINMSIFC